MNILPPTPNQDKLDFEGIELALRFEGLLRRASERERRAALALLLALAVLKGDENA